MDFIVIFLYVYVLYFDCAHLFFGARNFLLTQFTTVSSGSSPDLFPNLEQEKTQRCKNECLKLKRLILLNSCLRAEAAKKPCSSGNQEVSSLQSIK